MYLQIWKCTTDESNRIVHDFFESQHFAAGILPIPGECTPLLPLDLRRLSMQGAATTVISTSLPGFPPLIDTIQEHHRSPLLDLKTNEHFRCILCTLGEGPCALI